jgi:sec-independent protein translocase protein TatA
MPLGLHLPELIIVLVVALLIFGPKKLPEMGSAIGKAITEFRKGMSELTAPKDQHDEENKLATSATELPPATTSTSKSEATAVKEDAHVNEMATSSEEKSTEVKID